MCCNYKTPIVEALNLFRDQTGLRIGQKEWHLLRNAAEARMHADGTLAPDQHLTNARADAARVIEVATAFAASLKVDSVTSTQFVDRLAHTGMSHGNAATLDEVTRKIRANEPVGGVARQPKNGKNVTKTDLIDRAGGFIAINPNQAAASAYTTPTRVERPENETWDTTPAVAHVVPTTAGQRLLRTLEPVLRSVHAHHGIVTTAGTTFEIGERTNGGYAFVLKAQNAPEPEPLTITVGRWRNERTCDIVTRVTNATVTDAELLITQYGQPTTRQTAA